MRRPLELLQRNACRIEAHKAAQFRPIAIATLIEHAYVCLLLNRHSSVDFGLDSR